jgi:PAS domain S-box-containing protein
LPTLSAELVRSVLDSAPDAMVIIDEAGTILYGNRQLATLFGHTGAELVGRSIEELIPGRFRQRHAGHRQRFSESRRLRPMGMGLDLFALRKDGTEFPVEISLSPIGDGDAMLVAAAIRDVTDRKRTERDLRNAHAAADRANHAKSRFLKTASHDLRQPLQTLGLLNGALRRLVGDADALEAIGQQEQAIGAMSRLLNALLDVSKLESGSVRPQLADFSVGALLEALRGEFSAAAAAKGLELIVEPSPLGAHSDVGLVGQVLRNLLSNAIKYTSRGSVRLRARRGGEFVRIDVIDSGIGIAADQIDHIYDEFYQVGVPANCSRDGYGLGLSIVEHIARLLDLRVDVESAPGSGSTFSVTLPESATASAPRQHSRVQARAGEDTGGRAVLLIEDEPGVRNATRMLLKVSGYRVAAVAGIREALAVVEDAGPKPELVVTDYHLGSGETGVEAIIALRGLLGPRLKAILVTGDTSLTVGDLPRDELLRVARKPIDADELLAAITELLAAP